MENERIIIETDGDLEAVASVTATVNANGELVVEHDFEDYEDEGNNFTKTATVEKEEALKMAESLAVEVKDLPDELYAEFGEMAGVGVPSDAECVFADILDFILDCGAKYSLK